MTPASDTVTVEIALGTTKRAPAECEYVRTDVPGLVIARLPNDRWAPVHHRSGATVGNFPTVAEARVFVSAALVPLGLNWEVPATELDGKLPRSLEGYVRLLGGRWRGHRPSGERYT